MELFKSVEAQNVEEVRRIVEKDRSSVCCKDNHGVTPLLRAAQLDSIEVLKAISKSKKCDFNAQDEHGWSALHNAAHRARYDMCLVLLANKHIKTNLVTADSNTPLHYLCKRVNQSAIAEYQEVLSMMLKRNADINARNRHGELPLHYACLSGNLPAVDFLCRNNCFLDAANAKYCTSLYYAITSSNASVVRKLLEFGADTALATPPDVDLESACKACPEVIDTIKEANTLDVVLKRKMQQLEDVNASIVQQMSELDDKKKQQKSPRTTSGTVHRRKKSEGGRDKLRPDGMLSVATSKKKESRSVRIRKDNLQGCERLDGFRDLFVARCGPWSCAMKKIECHDSGQAMQVYGDMTCIEALSHENLLQYLHHTREQSNVQLFVEAPSITLRDYILEQKEVLQHSGKPLGLDVIQSIALAVASGLNYLDDHQLLNRNVRSTQIYAIRGPRGSPPRFVLNNFYAVNQKLAWKISEKNMEYYADCVYGLAPEVHKTGRYSYQSDVWGFAMVLYELLCLEEPYHYLNSPDEILKHMKNSRPKLPQHFTTLAKLQNVTEGPSPYSNLFDLFEMCSCVDPSQRPRVKQIYRALSENTSIKAILGMYHHKQAAGLMHWASRKPSEALFTDADPLNISSTVSAASPATSPGRVASAPACPDGSHSADEGALLSPVVAPELTTESRRFIVKQVPCYTVEHPIVSNDGAVLDNPCLIQYHDGNIPFYANSMYPNQHDNFIASTEDGAETAVVSIESEPTTEAGKLMYKVLVRTQAEDVRLLNCCETAKDRLKNLKSLPILSKFKYWERVKEPSIGSDLYKFEKAVLEPTQYKFGVLYRKKGQHLDDDMFSNATGSMDFNIFLRFLGQQITLKGWTKFKGGLDVKDNTTGKHAVYTTLDEFEMLFHVSTMLPYDPDNKQQLHRKRHLGNDIVLIIFQDADADPFTPEEIASHFNHVFIVIQPVRSGSMTARKTLSLPARDESREGSCKVVPARGFAEAEKSIQDHLDDESPCAATPISSPHRDDEEAAEAETTDTEGSTTDGAVTPKLYVSETDSKAPAVPNLSLAGSIPSTNRLFEVFCDTNYKVSVISKEVVTVRPRPYLDGDSIYPANEGFHRWLLTKLINCERAAMKSEKFQKMSLNTRSQLLEHLLQTYDKRKQRKG